MTAGNFLVDTIRIGLVAAAGQYAGIGNTRTVVQDDVTRIMVLVEAFRLVINSQTAIHKDIHRSLVRTALETVAITLRSNLVERKETVLIRDTVLDDNGHIITKSAFLLIEHIPAVI